MYKTQTKIIIIAALLILIGAILVLVVGVLLTRQQNNTQQNQTVQTPPPATTVDMAATPTYTIEEVKTNLNNPWDIGFFSNGTIVFTERSGKISFRDNEKTYVIDNLENLFSQGEGGLMSLAMDPEFDSNKYLYVCLNSMNGLNVDVRVARLELNSDYSVNNRKDIVTEMPSTLSGRHSGCQLEFGPDGYLWIGTGDAAIGKNSQDPKNLGGKILRVDSEGEPAEGNLGGNFDPRIFSYGHRNVQGITFLKTTSTSNPIGVSAEHGPGIDDEINMLEMGNFGWDPVPFYNESVPMTDKEKFPNAIDSIWSSGDPTIATSGITQITGTSWKLWDGAIAVASLAGKQVKIFKFNEDGNLDEITTILTDIGRVRTIQQGIDENLYVLTDNGEDSDRILRLVAQ